LADELNINCNFPKKIKIDGPSFTWHRHPRCGLQVGLLISPGKARIFCGGVLKSSSAVEVDIV
jgi:hypothetical protein